eukprot:gene34395-41628_t
MLLVVWLLAFAFASASPQMLLVNEYSSEGNKVAHVRPQASNTPCAAQIDGVYRLHKTLLFVDSAFIDLFKNWLFFFSQVCGQHSPSMDQLLIVCVDGDASNMVQELNVTCHHEYSSMVQNATYQAILSSPTSNSTVTERRLTKKKSVVRHVIWMKRLEIVSVLLQRGEDVLLSDLDAIWLQNPYTDISTHLQAGSSVISSRATFPEEISRVWGRSLCMGFIYLKADKFTNYLLPLVLQDMQHTYDMFSMYEQFLKTGRISCTDLARNATMVFDRAVFSSMNKRPPDDQLSFNFVLRNLNISWQKSAPLKIFNSSRSYNGKVLGTDGSVNIVTMLPEDSFLRNCVDVDHLPLAMRYFKLYPTIELRDRVRQKAGAATVAHCLISTTEAKKKESYLVFYGLYALPYNAQDVSTFLLLDGSSGAATLRPPSESNRDGLAVASLALSTAAMNKFLANATGLNEYLEKRKKRAQRIRDLLRNSSSSSSSWSHGSHSQRGSRSGSTSSRRQVVSYVDSKKEATGAPTSAATFLVTVQPSSLESKEGQLFLRGSRRRPLDESVLF